MSDPVEFPKLEVSLLSVAIVKLSGGQRPSA